MRILHILHADFETPGNIHEWAKKNKFDEKICRPFAGETLPEPSEFDLLIVLSGPPSALAIEKDPYLADEIDLIKKTISKDIPVLGFCLGAHLIGEALGASTERSPHKEVGVFPIHLNEEGKKDPALKSVPSKFQATVWHNNMPGLTADAKVLAFSEGCPRQIVRYSHLVYGFQCHPEITKQNATQLVENRSYDLNPEKYVQSAKELLAHDFDPINHIMIRILDNFLRIVKTS